MIFWFAIALMTALVVLVVGWPLLRGRTPAPNASAHGIAVYLDQLAELERDRVAGRLGDGEAAAAKLEIERRILREAATAVPAPKNDSRRVRLATASLLALLMPGLAILLYLRLGWPDMPDQPLSARPSASSEERQDPASLVAELERRLIDGSSSAAEWTRLGRGLMSLRKPKEAARAFGKAVALAPEEPELISAYGEALVEANDGSVIPAAREAFDKALRIDPDEPRARFYRGLALAQQGDAGLAVDAWLALELDSPADALWLPVLKARLEETARAGRIDLEERRASLREANPAAAPASTGAGVPVDPAARGAMIRAMVDGLAERLKQEPGDLEGWRRLARSYAVLGEREKALEAHTEAIRLAPDRIDVLLDYAHTIYPPGKTSGPLPDAFVSTMRRVLRLAPENPEALFFVGEAEAEAGNKARAGELWRKLLAQLDPASPTHGAIRKRIDGLAVTN
ncbi:MAG: c-type cytochrome biogenesis protein CcmI [Proteobacteria bacterium]|nr:c-type cytochrome biogenesis protein CcmI [Pseudomonadota bacterium]MBI3499567.1 c-type cytochrome biogenesis protein CcmI [Pseudomonadota bacterium]